MKKLNYLFVALMTMLLAVSCSQDETFSIDTNSSEALVSFNLELPGGPQTRAIGDGTGVDKLVYAIYEDGVEITNLSSVNTDGFPQTLNLSTIAPTLHIKQKR